MRPSFLIFPIAFALARALATVEVISPDIAARSFKIPTSLTNITRYEMIQTSSVSPRNLDLTARGPSAISAYIETKKRQNIAAVGLFGAIASGFASSLTASCSIGVVLSYGSACLANVILFGFFFIASNYFLFFAPRPATQSLASEIKWNIEPQYVPEIQCGIKCKLNASAPLDKFATFGNATTDGNFYHLAYYQSSNTGTRGLRITRNSTLSSVASNVKRQEEADFGADPGSDGEVDYSAYVYWGEGSEEAFDEWNEDFSGSDEGLAESYGDWVSETDTSISCLTVTESNEADEALVSLWYFSEVPGVEYESPPDEVEELMDLCVTLN